MADFDPALVNAARTARAWPFEEARKVLARVGGKTPEKGHVLFETGYGPSGLPHIGTFGEVARTTMVRRAFDLITAGEIPTKLIAFSDDMDGFRKVPTNLPNQDMLAEHLHLPLTKVPDPFGIDKSFAHHNNRRLREFLDSFGFDYQFMSSTTQYQSGAFDDALMIMLAKFDDIMGSMLPTLGPDRRATYSPFLPISPTTGQVLQVPTLERDVARGMISFEDVDGVVRETKVTGGAVKIQWKPDWGLRWFALGVDYEMAGKDLIDSVKVSSRITKTLGGRAPEGFSYELFLDEAGQKISKSKGNGLSMEEWLTYAPAESLQYFMFQKPRTAKRLHFDVVPKAVDEYLTLLGKSADEPAEKLVENPAFHIHGLGAKDAAATSVTHGLSFALLLNLVSAANASDTEILWGFIQKYAPKATAETAPMLNQLAGLAVRYYEDFVKPTKQYKTPSDQERAALVALKVELQGHLGSTDGDAIQTSIFTAGKAQGYEQLRDWFKLLYQVLLGQEQGPRFGSFAALYGVDNTIALIDDKLGL